MRTLPVGARVSVRVPATSANLGPGFDALGLGLAWYDEVGVALAESGLVVETAADVPADESNLIVRAFRAGLLAVGADVPGLVLTADPTIPHARGLGSSAAAICAGVLAAFTLAEVDDRDLALQIAAELEGHPDNVAACLFGGLTVAWRGDSGRVRAVRLEPAPLHPVVFVPHVRTSTQAARGVLPDQVPHAVAARNAGRAALLVAALTERPDVLLDATEDGLHQPFRLPSLPVSDALVRALRAAGIPAVLSGSGPTVLALCRDADEASQAEAVAPSDVQVRSLQVDARGARAQADVR